MRKEGKDLRDFGVRLRLERKARALTQKALAARIGLSRLSVLHYEEGKHWPRPKSLAALVGGLGVSEDFLTGGTPRHGGLHDPKLLRLWSQLGLPEREIAAETIKTLARLKARRKSRLDRLAAAKETGPDIKEA